jgi:hypothetical protein
VGIREVLLGDNLQEARPYTGDRLITTPDIGVRHE